jgi:hypothetical protein
MELPHELEAALQALAASAEAQPSLFSAMSPTPDRLAADFDHWWRIVREEHHALERPQLRALREIQEQLAAMSIGVDRRNWTDDAMRRSPAWDRVRQLAVAALKELGWAESAVAPADGGETTPAP